MKIQASCPHFFVTDLERSVRFYVDVLGFDEPQRWGEPPVFAMPARDGFVIMLNEAGPEKVNPNGRIDCWDAYFWVDAIGDLWQRVEGTSHVAHPPEIRALYGMKELGVKDPDGYMIVFAEDVEA